MERINKEQKIQTLCESDYILKFYQRLETKENIIFELENYDQNLYSYLLENGPLEREKKLFKNIVISIAKALKTLNDKGFMHRDIKPHNIFIIKLDNKDKSIIKLGNFGCAIKIDENDFDSIGTILYNAPQKTQELDYNEKIDLWSLGVTLFQLYFGEFTYGVDADINAMMNIIYEEENFIFPKTFKKNEKAIIPTLDILFKRLLTINPEERMTHKEFFDYVFSDDFMKEGVTCVNNNQKYQKIFDDIKKEEFIEFKSNIKKENLNLDEIEKENIKKINKYIKGGNIPDIMTFPNASVNEDNKFNNIIYYDENKDHINDIKEDSDYFERGTPGAFILCTDMESFKLIRTEILTEIVKDKRIIFNLITTGSQFDNVMKFLNEDQKFKNCIKNICIYCSNIYNWRSLKTKYDLDYVVSKRKKVIDFIKKFSSEEIKPYSISKLLTLKDYLDKYKDKHQKISEFYGDLTPESYKNNIEKMELLIDQEKKENKLYANNENKVKKGFKTFDINKDLENLDKKIIIEYTQETIYSDLNKWLNNTKFSSFEEVAFFTSRLMFSLNNYGKNEKKYYNSKNKVYRGVKWSYSNILPFERAIGKIIILSAFTSTSVKINIAKDFSKRENPKALFEKRKKFSVIFHITNNFKKDWISNGIDIQNLSNFEYEKEVLYQPFSFYYVRNVNIKTDKYEADIELETIGKKEILEEQIKKGKEIFYNLKEKIMEVKN